MSKAIKLEQLQIVKDYVDNKSGGEQEITLSMDLDNSSCLPTNELLHNDPNNGFLEFKSSKISTQFEEAISKGLAVIRLDYPAKNPTSFKTRSYGEKIFTKNLYLEDGETLNPYAYLFKKGMIFLTTSDIKTDSNGNKFIYKKVSLNDITKHMITLVAYDYGYTRELDNFDYDNATLVGLRHQASVEELFFEGRSSRPSEEDLQGLYNFSPSINGLKITNPEQIGKSGQKILQFASSNFTNDYHKYKAYYPMIVVSNGHTDFDVNCLVGNAGFSTVSLYNTTKGHRGRAQYHQPYAYYDTRKQMYSLGSGFVERFYNASQYICRPRLAILKDNWKTVGNGLTDSPTMWRKTYPQCARNLTLRIPRIYFDYDANYGKETLLLIIRAQITK